MIFYSTKKQSPEVTLKDAVLKGLAPDNGLYMPEKVEELDYLFLEMLPDLTLAEIGLHVSKHLFGTEIPESTLKTICDEAFDFPTPCVKVKDDIYSLELFHGPTLAFKDVGARFMSRLMAHFNQDNDKELYILAATSGDTGSAVASGFYGVEGINVVLLYPSGKVSDIQEKQLTTFGGNITALEVDGTFDDCQKMVKEAFLDQELNAKMQLSSANSINIARLIPQSFYYFHAYGQLKKATGKDVVFSVPSGNFGNITGGVLAQKMGLSIKRFIAATNINDVVPEYLKTGEYKPRPSVRTIANAMDVGAPSNFDRLNDIFGGSHADFSADISGFTLADDEIRTAMLDTYKATGYVMDPHGAIGYEALNQELQAGEVGAFLETAHPTKFLEEVESTLDIKIDLPERLAEIVAKEKVSIKTSNTYAALKDYLVSL